MLPLLLSLYPKLEMAVTPFQMGAENVVKKVRGRFSTSFAQLIYIVLGKVCVVIAW